MIKKQKLELTWIGKDVRPKLELRILLGDPEKNYHAALRDVGATNSHKDTMPYVDLTKGRHSENGRASILLPCWPSANGVISRIFLVPVWW